VLKRLHYPLDVILTCVRWYVAYLPRLRHLLEIMPECGIEVDHSTVRRWAMKLLQVFEDTFRRCKCPVGQELAEERGLYHSHGAMKVSVSPWTGWQYS
jgi:transposase-like protein